MELKEFLRKASKRERADLADACHSSVSYLYQLAGQHRCASPRLALQLEIETGRVAAETHGRLAAVPSASLVRDPEFYAPDAALAALAIAKDGPVIDV